MKYNFGYIWHISVCSKLFGSLYLPCKPGFGLSAWLVRIPYSLKHWSTTYPTSGSNLASFLGSRAWMVHTVSTTYPSPGSNLFFIMPQKHQTCIQDHPQGGRWLLEWVSVSRIVSHPPGHCPLRGTQLCCLWDSERYIFVSLPVSSARGAGI